MVKDNQKLLNRLHVVLDGVIIVLSYLLAYFVQFDLQNVVVNPFIERVYFRALAFVIILYLILYGIIGMYQPKRVLGKRVEMANIVKANVLGVLIITLILYLAKALDFSRMLMFYFAVINTSLTIAVRMCLHIILNIARKSGYNLKHIIVIGYSRATEGFIDRIVANPQWGYNLRGILDDTMERGYSYKGIRVIGTIENLNMLLEVNRLDEIVVALPLSQYSRLEGIVNACEKSGVHTKFIPDYNAVIPTKPYTEDLLGLPVINIRHVPLTNALNKVIKRSMDIVGGIAAIIVFSPVMILAAILVKCTSKGPIIYRQERVGLHNRSFKMFKFRSMEIQPPSEEAKKWTTPNDPRVTTIGKLMRRTSIDELPQLFNVLRGDMSLVGPRPERPYFVEKFKEEIPRYMVKHQVRPGITGWAQVNGYRGDTSIKKRIDFDLYYIENWTIGLDFKILFLTIFKGFINKNAY